MDNADQIKAFIAEQPWDLLPRGTMGDLAARIGVTHASVYKWSRGHTLPAVQYWPAIEEIFGIQPRTLANMAGVSEIALTAGKRKAMLEQVSHAMREVARAQAALANLEKEIRSLT